MAQKSDCKHFCNTLPVFSKSAELLLAGFKQKTKVIYVTFFYLASPQLKKQTNTRTVYESQFL